MIRRELSEKLHHAAKYFPVITLLGPRQSGKTTLAQLIFKKHRYISLEDLDIRTAAAQDPREFLEFYTKDNDIGIILDEIQYVPSLLSYIQTWVDREKKSGYFILTGSQYFLVNQAVSQTLAGRMALFTLMPLSLAELLNEHLLPTTIEEAMFRGSYPALYAKDTPVSLWYRSYTQTYIERDVRQVTKIADLMIFKTFMRLCAGRIGQLLNVSALANDCGINMATAQTWLNLLQASYIIFLLQPHYKNFSKRLVKTPKLYFYDTGLAASLLEIESPEELHSHYLRGGLFECFMISDLIKQYYNTAREPRVYFWRDNHGHEVDCLIERGELLNAIEIKSGKTIVSDYFSTLDYWNDLTGGFPRNSFVLYGGNEDSKRSKAMVLSWRSTGHLIEKMYGEK